MPPIDITGLARHTLPMPCTWCSCDAVELAVTRESDERPDHGAHVLYTCRACDPDAFMEPDAEILQGDPVDVAGEPLALFEVPRVSTFGAQDRAATTGQTSIF